MGYSINDKIRMLLRGVSTLKEIKAIGQTGNINIVPKAGESDIDLFLLGDKIPDYEDRKTVYDEQRAVFEQCRMNVCEGGVWGTGDIFTIDGVETMLMYFRIDETLEYINDILEGKYLDSTKGFYPIGRLATFKSINILYDENETLGSIKIKLSEYPAGLMKKIVAFHLNKTNDEEDFSRAVMRKDVLFYHQVLEHSIDHFLQVLFAVNKTYFPSRKRTKQYLDLFKVKPVHCYDRLMEIITLGAIPESIENSYSEWCELVKDLEQVCNYCNFRDTFHQ